MKFKTRFPIKSPNSHEKDPIAHHMAVSQKDPMKTTTKRIKKKAREIIRETATKEATGLRRRDTEVCGVWMKMRRAGTTESEGETGRGRD